MQSRLIVKNFGPIDYVDLDLRNVNVFIGPQASGKSALAKLFTIFKAPRKFLNNPDRSVKEPLIAFKEVLKDYNIYSFLKLNTQIKFDSELHSLSYSDNQIVYDSKFLSIVDNLEILAIDFLENKKEILEIINKILQNYLGLFFKLPNVFESNDINDISSSAIIDKIDENNIQNVLDIIKQTEHHLSANAAIYIPSERNFINIVRRNVLNLLLNNVPIPKHILSFGAELEKIKHINIDLGFLNDNIHYTLEDGEDKIQTNGGSIELIEAASGIQSVIPILVPILHFREKSYDHRSFVIEEPELNLFPTAQYDLIKLLEYSRLTSEGEDYGSIHTYTTHSPYILSALNNLLYANKVRKTLQGHEKYSSIGGYNIIYHVIQRDVHKIVSSDIDPKTFTAYQIKDGRHESIFDREAGLIKDNYIDAATDKMADDFEALMNLMK